jgi:hypothetical protein
MLTVALLFMSWLPQPTLRRRFDAAYEALALLYPGRRRPGRSYQGLAKAMLAHSPRMLEQIESHLRRQMRSRLASCWTMRGFETFTADGSRVAVPRTIANDAALGTGGRDGAMPQATLTTLLHMGSGVPWDYRVGAANASERDHLRDMLPLLPAGALLVADAGFTGYELLRDLLAAGGDEAQRRHILIRCGANVSLLRKLGFLVKESRDTVYLWPADARRAGGAPLALRLIRLNGRGGYRVCLLTDLPAARLSREDAGDLYRMRWGIEAFYRSLKQTMRRTKMLSASPEMAKLELRWTMIGLWLLRLFNAVAMVEKGRDPLRGSVAQSLAVMETHLRHLGDPPRRAGGTLWQRLADARQDAYRRTRSKQSRDYPRQKTSVPPTQPKVRCANRQERDRAKQIASQMA